MAGPQKGMTTEDLPDWQVALHQQQTGLLRRLFGKRWEAAAERLRYLEARRQGGSAKR